MKPCRHLDYTEGTFTHCTIQTCAPHFPDVRYWLRGPEWTDNGPGEKPNPAKVQFCRSRGRINEVFACYTPGALTCYEPQEARDEPPVS